jgi:VWFA-related protein
MSATPPMSPKPANLRVHRAKRARRAWPPATGVALALALLLAAGAPARLAAAERFSGEATNVVAVEVPVEVVKDGEPVRGLTAANFEVSEGRKKLKITGFDVVDLSVALTQPDAAPAPLPIAARRHFLLLFDLTFSEPKSVLKARQAAADLVAKSLHPTDLVAVATYSATKGPQLALGFTADRRQIASAIDTLGVVQPLERTQTADPLRLVYASELSAASNPVSKSRSEAAKIDKSGIEAELLDTLKGLSEATARQDRQNQVTRVVALSQSLADLARMMGNVEGRKFVVYLSEGFDSSLLTGTTDATETQQYNQTKETTPWAVDTEAHTGDSRTLDRLEKMFDAFRRADCVIQAVDIGGLRGSGDQGYTRPNGKDALFNMAKSTGGELYENWNDLGAAMGAMLKRTSVTYVLTLQPDDLKLDGAYHKISVDLKNAPRGARVVVKPGYFAPRPFAQKNPLERLLNAADTIVGGAEGGTIGMSVLAAPFHLNTGPTAYVPVVMEIDGPGLLANQQGEVAPTEVYAYALDSTGAVRDFFSQTLGLDLSKVGPQLKSSGLKFFGHLDLPPGDYSLRVMVRNGKTGVYSLRVVPVKVPAFAQAAGPVLLPPFFSEPAGRWLMTREAKRATGSQDAPYPFMIREQPFIPSSRPVVSAGQDAQLSLVVYNLGEGEVKADAKVLGADGKELQAADFKVTDRERGSAANPDRLTASFKAPQLSPGEYRLQVTLSAGGGARQTSSIPFLVAKPGARG